MKIIVNFMNNSIKIFWELKSILIKMDYQNKRGYSTPFMHRIIALKIHIKNDERSDQHIQD